MDFEKLLTDTWVPTWVMVLVVAALTVSLVVGVPLAGRAGKRRGKRLAHPEQFAGRKEKAKDTAIFLAALIPTLLVWLSVMGVSFIGLTGFASDVMNWNHWTNILVPLSLDGISVSFGAWAFVAVKRGRHPGRAYKIVLAAATVSATLNFVHGRDVWSIWAGLYLAFLSMAGMAMFHELLDQFMVGYDDEIALRTKIPRFGQRWLYAPLSTFMARRAWIVHPPEDDLRATVRNALDHLEAVREARRQRRLDGAFRVREETQAKLVEVQARNEVRRAKAAGRRVEIPHLPAQLSHHAAPAQPAPAPAQPGQPPAQNGQPPSQPQYEPALQFAGQPTQAQLQQAAERGLVFDDAVRAQLETVLPVTNGREPLGRHPLADQHAAETQRMIAEALAMGDQVTAGQVRDWMDREYGFRPSETWARNQIRAVRSRDTVGVDADLL